MLAIELDGVYWYKERELDGLVRTNLCEAQGIQLLHVYDCGQLKYCL